MEKQISLCSLRDHLISCFIQLLQNQFVKYIYIIYIILHYEINLIKLNSI